MADKIYKFDKSFEMFRKAVNVIPGGIYGSKSPNFAVPGSFPYFITHGKGCYIYDVDGNEYIDFLCGFGTNLLGYGYEPVNKKVAERMAKGEIFNTASPEFVELAEMLVKRIDSMDWALYGKNGTDVTTFAVTLARIETDKKKVVMAKGAYHGTAPWAAPSEWTILDEKKNNLYFNYNDIEGLKKLFEKHRGEIAAIILTPYHHPAFGDSIMPSKDFYPAVEALCKDEGALFIMDDIRCNFRLHPNGSHKYFGAHPDLICMGKSLGNGHPVSVVMGTKDHYKAATDVYATGTFWFQAGALVAAMESLKEFERLKTVDKMMKTGKMLQDGLASCAKDEGLDVVISGAPTIPFMSFKGDKDLYYNQIFCSETTKRGVYLHPHHNWFLSAAHTEKDIDKALGVARIAFKAVRQAMGL